MYSYTVALHISFCYFQEKKWMIINSSIIIISINDENVNQWWLFSYSQYMLQKGSKNNDKDINFSLFTLNDIVLTRTKEYDNLNIQRWWLITCQIFHMQQIRKSIIIDHLSIHQYILQFAPQRQHPIEEPKLNPLNIHTSIENENTYPSSTNAKMFTIEEKRWKIMKKKLWQ